MATDRIGSMGVQPVARMTSAAAMAAAEPSRSLVTWISAARTLRLRAAAAMQDPERDRVDDQAGGGDDQHGAADHRHRLHEALHRLPGDGDRDEEQRQPVDEGGQHLEAVEAVGALPVGGARRDPHGEPGERQRRGIGQHVAGVGEQRQRPGDDAADRLGQHGDRGQQAGPEQAALVGAGLGVRVAVVLPALRLPVAVSGPVSVPVMMSHAVSALLPVLS